MKFANLLQVVLLAAGVAVHAAAVADPLAPELQAKTEKYRQKLVEWAADPAVVGAVRDANAKGAPAMNNAKWEELADADVAVKAYTASPMGKQLAKWEEDKNISKLFLRDAKGNLVAASSKPLLFNNANRPVIVNTLKGSPWIAAEVKPDPSTQKRSVQIGAPVMEGGKVIGVLHTAVDAQ